MTGENEDKGSSFFKKLLVELLSESESAHMHRRKGNDTIGGVAQRCQGNKWSGFHEPQVL